MTRRINSDAEPASDLGRVAVRTLFADGRASAQVLTAAAEAAQEARHELPKPLDFLELP
jgi:hypothetical protein